MQVSIIGLGWLGEPLAKYLHETGFSVKGSTTTEGKKARLEKQGFQVYSLQLNPHPVGEKFHPVFETDVLLINIPPSTRTKPDNFHPRQIKSIRALAENAGIPKIIYASATSIYPDLNQVATEEDIIDLQNTGNKTLLQAENILKKDKSYDLTIVRFGGLLGDDRIPGKYFSGKKGVAGHPPVNYIHRQDAVRLLHWILKNQIWNETINAASPFHPARKEIYENNAANLTFPPPASYDSEEKLPWKKISSEKLVTMGFTFLFENPLDYPYFLSKAK